MKKTLAATTLIPPELYIRRKADDHLNTVVSEMGRPGYVLVARQMGKTNLLINLKRETETASDAFVYVDVSGSFGDLREYFRSVTDVVLDVIGNAELSEEISKQRLAAVPPQKEHERELRTVLRKISGKLVLILDEIDSLTNCTFSDQIFAQIRSIYFSRITYSEFSRLTYVLSGVAEPTQLIKDKAISPFNIGQKILLDDFNLDQVSEFIKRAGLEISADLVRDIYEWTSGNPRITWDVCAEIEERIGSGANPEMLSIDDIVRSMYLKSYDRAPVDHIRKLVEQDREIREAIIQLHYGMGETLSNETKTKLYLSGIIGPDFDEKIKIKNKVIEESLSDSFISDLDKKDKVLLRLAQDSFSGGKYEEALVLYNDYISKTSFNAKNEPYTCYAIATSHYGLRKYSIAVEWFLKCQFDKTTEPALAADRNFSLGVCYTSLNKPDEAIPLLKEIYENGRGKRKFQAGLNLAAAYFKKDAKSHFPEICSINSSISQMDATTARNEGIELSEIGQLTVPAFYNLGSAYEENGENRSAESAYKSALNICRPNQKPDILLRLANIANKEDRDAAIIAAGESIIASGLIPIQESGPESLLQFDLKSSYEIIGYFGELDRGDLLITYIDKMKELKVSGFLTRSTAMLTGAALSVRSDRREQARLLLAKIEEEGSATLEERLAAARLGLAQKLEKNAVVAERNFLRLANEYRGEITVLDVRILLAKAMREINSGELDRALFTVQSAISMGGRISESAKINLAVFYYFEIECHGLLGNKDLEMRAAERALKFIDECAVNGVADSSIIEKRELERIKDRANQTLGREVGKLVPFVNESKKIGRNNRVKVIYQDGTTLVDKYKRLIADIESGACQIVEQIK